MYEYGKDIPIGGLAVGFAVGGRSVAGGWSKYERLAENRTVSKTSENIDWIRGLQNGLTPVIQNRRE